MPFDLLTSKGIQFIGLVLLAIASIFDIFSRKVPNLLILLGLSVGIFLNAFYSSDLGFTQSVYGGFLGFLLFFYPFYKGHLGAGDVKLFAMAGVFIGPYLTLWAFVFVILCGGFFSLISLIVRLGLRHLKDYSLIKSVFKLGMPYAVPIFFGTLMAVINLQGLRI